MKHWEKSRIVLITVSLCVIVFTFFMQSYQQGGVDSACSYLDPWIVDALAFSVAIFLVLEGVYRIAKHKNVSITRQVSRVIRVGIGLAIITIHTMQVLHKF
ncbi:hypothetical protein GOV14_01070 [Candidatus Pacearchaeota archaeon]|nr:hypothetical protein [Candidatus Pacearchaeota archaeon]